jgi:hypothetical protein
MTTKRDKYSSLHPDTFDRILREVINDSNPITSDVLAIPGVYEILVEHYNNEVLETWEREHACDECDAFIPPDLPSEINTWHDPSCSLYPEPGTSE